MKKKWTLFCAVVLQIVGMFIGTSLPNYYGTRGIADFAMLIGAGIPYLILGAIVGLTIDFFVNKNKND